MLRKLIVSLLSFLPFALPAQLATGSWRVYPAFGTPDKLIETPDLVYLATAGTLHSYDKSHDESRSFLPGTDLGGSPVKDIFYNTDGRYLLVAYGDANIDIIPDDGDRISLPDIRDANVNRIKEINDVKFADGLIYVATSFGIVIYDENGWEVRESAIFDYPVTAVALTPDRLLVATNPADNTFELMAAPRDGRHNNINRFTRIGGSTTAFRQLIPLQGNEWIKGSHFAMRGGNNRLYYVCVSDDPTAEATISDSGVGGVTSLFLANGDAYATAGGKLYHYNAPWNAHPSISLPEPLAGCHLSTLTDTGSLWAADSDGLGHYSLADDGQLTVLRDKYRPSDATTFSDVSHIIPLPDRRGFMIANQGLSAHLPVGNGDFLYTPFTGNIIEDGQISDIKASEDLTFVANVSNYKPSAAIFSPTFLLEDPDDPSIHYIGSANEGVYVVRDGKQIAKFDHTNSPIVNQGTWRVSVNSAHFDSKGNLLIGVYTEDATKSPLVVLPADKRRKDPATIVKDDWVTLDMGGDIHLRDVAFHVCSKVPAILMVDAQYKKGFSALHYGSSVTDPSDDTPLVITTLTDQDGKTFTPDYLLCFAEDSRGRVWIGTTEGPVEISNPSKIFSSDFNINRLKVPRNDGTNLADYLLDTETVYAIAVDASDRKWIATAASGLYLVSENGDEILANFNTSNSPLPTNCITDVFVDPNSNSVFVSTLNGLYEYSSTSSPGRPDYSDVVAYPNPVTPEYTGLITIRGLMDSSLVKIMDSGMHLIYQTTSEGGMATWDGCTLSGTRAKSGVYYVFASVSSETDSQGDVVAKILIVN